MELLSGVAAFGGTYLLPFLVVLTVVVFVHELGHFLAARWCGVHVTAFSIGFGPEIAGFTDRKGTRWKLSWIPLGGYVKFLGDENAASTPDQAALAQLSEIERRHSFFHKPLWQRALIVAAGPIANFLLSIAVFALVLATLGRPMTLPKVDAISPGSVAEAAGFRVGDLILSIDGVPVETFSDMQRLVSGSAGRPLTFEVDRNGQRLTLTATPEWSEVKDRFGNTHRTRLLGIQRQPGTDEVWVEHYDPAKSLWLATKQVYQVTEQTLSYVAGVIAGRESPNQIGGPITILKVSGQVATIGFLPFINLLAILSVSIGLINLFPIPMLDGGHLLYYGIEAVRGRPLSERAQEMGFRIGLAIVLMLMVFATWNDLTQWKLL